MSKLLPFLFLFTFYTSEAQSWQNITPQKGGYPLTSIQTDSKQNLYVFCHTGMYTSANQGLNWIKLGRNVFTAYRLIEPSVNLGYENVHDLVILKDTLHLFVRASSGFYKCLVYDKGKGQWLLSSKTLTSKRSPDCLVKNNNSGVGYLNNEINNSTYQLIYSLDGMKSWKKHPRLFSSGQLFVFGGKWSVYQSDTLFQFDQLGNLSFQAHAKTQNYGAYSSVNKKLVRYFVKSFQQKDSLLVEELDTLTAKWKYISKKGLSTEFHYNSINNYKVTESGWFIAPVITRILCTDAYRITKDWGMTWQTIETQKYESYLPYGIPFQEVNGKLFFHNAYMALQLNSESKPFVFDYTDPEGFGFQGGILRNYSVTKNYVGNQMNVVFCDKDSLDIRRRWNGTSWTNVLKPKLPLFIAQGRLYGTSNYYVRSYNTFFSYTKDEGNTFDSIRSPITRFADVNLTETGHVFFAVDKNKLSDTLYVSKDHKNWTIKKTPLSVFGVPGTGFSRLDFKGDTLYLVQGMSTQKKIFASADQGDSWEDVTYNVSQNLVLNNAASYEKVLDNATRATVLPLTKPNSYVYQMYKLNKPQKSWDFLDSSHFYLSNNFPIDTALRLAIDVDKFIYELRLADKPWINLNYLLNDLEKGDTILNEVPALSYNAKGLFAKTNYGLFFLPYPDIVAGLDRGSEMSDQPFYRLFPNPAENSFYLQTTDKTVGFELTDVTGNVLDRKVNWQTSESISSEYLKPGLYLLRIIGTRDLTIKFIKR